MAFLNWLSVVTKSSGSAWQGRSQSLPSRLLHEPYYRMQSLEEVQVAIALGIKIDVNRATVDDWLRLPGISIHQARTLADLTQAGVQFCCLEDIAAALNTTSQRLQPFAGILSFCYYDPESLVQGQRVNANTATVEQLLTIAVVDLFLARAIVQERSLKGKYRNLADLQKRLHLPATLTTELLHYLQF